MDLGIELGIWSALETEIALEQQLQTVIETDLGLIQQFDGLLEFELGLALQFNAGDQVDLALELSFHSAQDLDQAAAVFFSTGVEANAGGGAERQPYCVLVSDKTEYPISEWTCSQEVNGAWQWSSNEPRLRAIDFADGQTFKVYAGDKFGNPLETPNLVACQPRRRSTDIRGGNTTALAGVDLASWKMTLPGQSWPTFRNTSAAAICAAIAGRAGTNIVNAPGFPVFEEDIKQSDLWAALLRIAEVEAANVLIDPDGSIRFVPVRWTSSQCEFYAEKVEEVLDVSRRVTQLKFAKRLAAAMEGEQRYTFNSSGYRVVQLKNPLNGPSVIELSRNGKCGLIGFWRGDPGGPGARLVRYYSMGFNADGLTVPSDLTAGAATHMSLSVAEATPPFDQFPVDAEVLVVGTPPELAPAGLDLAFECTVGSDPSRPASGVRTEPLYPSKGHVLARGDSYLWELNKQAHQVEASGPLQYAAALGQTMEFPDYPIARIERIEHRCNVQGTGTTLKGFAIPWLV